MGVYRKYKGIYRKRRNIGWTFFQSIYQLTFARMQLKSVATSQ